MMWRRRAPRMYQQPGPEAALLLEHVLLEADAPVLEIRVQLFAAALQLLLDLVLGRRMRSTSSLILGSWRALSAAQNVRLADRRRSRPGEDSRPQYACGGLLQRRIRVRSPADVDGGWNDPCGSVLVLLVHLAQQEVKCRAMRPGGGVRAMETPHSQRYCRVSEGCGAGCRPARRTARSAPAKSPDSARADQHHAAFLLVGARRRAAGRGARSAPCWASGSPGRRSPPPAAPPRRAGRRRCSSGCSGEP